MAAEFEPVSLSGVTLSGIDLFRDVSSEDRDQIAGLCTGRRYQPDAQIVSLEEPSAEEPSADVHFIVGGTVRVTFFSASGKEISFRDQHAGQMFGEISAIDGRGRSAYVVAMTEVLLATMGRERFMKMIAGHPELAVATLKHVANLVRLLSDRVVEFSTLGVKNRIHAELLRLAGESGSGGNEVEITPAPKHADIASRISTHREAVTRELNELDRAGLIRREPNLMTICDVAQLTQLVEEVRGV